MPLNKETMSRKKFFLVCFREIDRHLSLFWLYELFKIVFFFCLDYYFRKTKHSNCFSLNSYISFLHSPFLPYILSPFASLNIFFVNFSLSLTVLPYMESYSIISVAFNNDLIFFTILPLFYLYLSTPFKDLFIRSHILTSSFSIEIIQFIFPALITPLFLVSVFVFFLSHLYLLFHPTSTFQHISRLPSHQNRLPLSSLKPSFFSSRLFPLQPASSPASGLSLSLSILCLLTMTPSAGIPTGRDWDVWTTTLRGGHFSRRRNARNLIAVCPSFSVYLFSHGERLVLWGRDDGGSVSGRWGS